MPEISKCPSCEKSLLQSLDHLAKTANDAVFNVASSESEDEKDEEHKEDDEPGQLSSSQPPLFSLHFSAVTVYT